jgi:peptidoglycan/xylan/chitin deacetylase (PgdA/CDA1 family)
MKSIIISATIGLGLIASINASAKRLKQFPNSSHVYRPKVDSGFEQYRTKSMRNTREVVLTFDDGPHKTRTPKVLDILKKYNAKATFFVLTKNINSGNIHILERMMHEGHIVASHDHDHDNNNNESKTQFSNELTASIKLLEDLKKRTGVDQKENYYRFPYGAYGRNSAYHHFNVMKDVSNNLYGENCINFAFWDIDTADWLRLKPSQIAQNIISHVDGGVIYKPKKVNGRWIGEGKTYRRSTVPGGGVALLHDIHERSVQATEIFLKQAKKKGIRVVALNTVDEFKYDNSKSCVYGGSKTRRRKSKSNFFRNLFNAN